MKILHCITGLTGDGAQRMLLRLTQGLQECGVESEVVNLGGPTAVVDDFTKSRIPVYSLQLSPTGRDAVYGAFRLKRMIRQIQPDLVQAWMYHANIVSTAAIAGTDIGVPVAWNIRRGLDDYEQRKLKTRLVIRSNALLSGRPARIIYCSKACKAQHEDFGFSTHGGVVLENGFDAERFQPSELARRQFRQLHGIRDGEFVIGMVGRFDVAKGHSYLIEAFRRIASIIPNSRLVLLGRGMDEQRSEVAKTLSAFGLCERVLLLGEHPKTESVYPGFDLYCSSSINEGFPNAISEAMACGVPCVVTDTGASREIVEGIGLVVESRSPDQLAKAMVTMATKSKDELRRRGERARERIVSRYSLRGIVRQYCDLYEGVASARESVRH